MVKFKCPECGDDDLIIYQVVGYKMNTEEYFCTSVKTHDEYATVWCMECNWEGVRSDIDNVKEKQ